MTTGADLFLEIQETTALALEVLELPQNTWILLCTKPFKIIVKKRKYTASQIPDPSQHQNSVN